jgi:hypothetical protein
MSGRLVFAVGALWMALGAVPANSESPDPPTITDAEAYAVYASLLPDHWLIQHARATSLVFQRETSTRPMCDPIGKTDNEVWRPVVEAFRSANAQTRAIHAGEPLGFPYAVVPAREIRAIFEYSDTAWVWIDFLAKFPGSAGCIDVSAVGFDEQKTRAMVYLAHHCGYLCGGGRYYYLEKSEGRWQKVRRGLKGTPSCFWAS